MISQGKWRIAGGLFLAGAVLMVAASSTVVKPGMNLWILVGYWGVFALLLLAALYIAFLDLRYTRMQYKITERDLFKDTFMTPEFRQAIQDAVKEQDKQNQNAE